MNEETLFAEAIELPPEDRAAFLDGKCGDDAELRKRVEILLRSHDQADSFLAKPAEEDFDVTLDISVDDPELIEARSAELRKSQAAKPVPPKAEPRPDDHEPASVVVKKGEHGERILYFGDYELQGEIARGAMGVVYRAEQKSLKRIVAIKMIRSTLLTNEMDVTRFKAEAEAAASLDHPNIVPIYEVGMHEEQHYFTMKLIEGGTLRDHLERLKQAPKAAATLMSTVAGAIHTAHQRGILHRDLKPGNILVDEAGEPHVTDFGLAKQMESNSSVTLSGQIMGTPQYMAPEQAEGGGKELTTAADVYALGAIFYELLCGKPPHVGASLMDTLKLVAEEEAAPPSKHHPKVDRDLETIAMKCLEKDPEKRYASAQGLKNDLDRWLRGEPIEARPVGTSEKVVKWMKRKPVHAAAGLLGALFLLTLGVGGPIAALKQANLKKDADASADLAEKRAKESVEARKLESKARQRADVAASLAEDRSAEIRKTLFASEMQLAWNAGDHRGGTRRMKALLDLWRPEEGETDLRGWEWYYLRSQLEQAELTLDHPASVGTADWSRDGKVVFTGCDDGTIRIWNAETGRLLKSLTDHAAEIRTVAVSPGGDRLASVDAGGSLKIREIATGELQVESKALGGGLKPLAWSPDGMRIAVGLVKEVLIFEANSGEVVTRLPINRYAVSVAWSPDGKLLAIGKGFDLIIWNSETGERLVHEANFNNSLISDTDWDARGEKVVVTGTGIYLADATSDTVTEWMNLQELSGFGSQRRSAFSPSHEQLASASFDREIRLIDWRSGELAGSLRGHEGDIHDVCWSPAGDRLLSSDSEGAVRIWRMKSGLNSGAKKWGRSVAWRPGSGELALGSWGKVSLHEHWSEPESRKFASEPQGQERVAWSTDGERIIVASGGRWAILERQDDGKLKPALEVKEPNESSGFSYTAWEPGGDRLIIGGASRLAVFSTRDGELLREWNGLPYCLEGQLGAWHPEGRYLACYDGKSMAVIDLDTGNYGESWAMESNVTTMAWHPSGEILATARGGDYLVELWELPGARKMGEIDAMSMRILSLAWSPDGTLLAIGGEDGVVHLWSRTLDRVVLDAVQDGPVTQLAWDDSGTKLAVMTKAGLNVLDAAPGYLAEGSSRALIPLDQLILADPYRVLYRVQRSGLLEKLGRRQEAIEGWDELAKLHPNEPYYAELSLTASLREPEPSEAIARLENRLAENPDDVLAANFLARRLLAEAGPEDWELLEVEEAVSEDGAFLLPQPDGSLLAAGENPDADVYRITGKTKLSRVSAIRLETIPDERLPKGGSGRNPDNGTFHLGDFSVVRMTPPGQSREPRLPIEAAWADFAYVGDWGAYPIRNAFDKDPDSGWDPTPRQRERHTVVFQFTDSQDLTASAGLTVRLQAASRGGRYPQHNLGRFRLAVTDRPQAARAAEIAHTLQENSEAYEPWTLIGIARSLRGESAEAAEAFSRALDDADGNGAKTRILAEVSRDEAVFAKLMELRPEEQAILAQSTEALTGAGHVEEAIALLSRAIAAEPESLPLRLARGKAYAADKRWEEAGRDLVAALGPDHNVAKDFGLRADVFEQIGQWEAAEADWRQALSLSPGNRDLSRELMNVLSSRGSWDAAAEAGERQFETDPGDGKNWLGLAAALVCAGDEDGYDTFRERVVGRLDPEDQWALRIGIRACLLMSPSTELLDEMAVKVSEERVELGRVSPDERPWIRGSLALLELRQGKLEGAIASTVSAMETPAKWAPEMAAALNLSIRAIAQAEAGNFEAARRSLEETATCLETKPKTDYFNWLIADILRREAEAVLAEKEE